MQQINTEVINFFEVTDITWPSARACKHPVKTLENKLGSFQTTFIHETEILKIREYSYMYFKDQTVCYTHRAKKYIEISFFLHETAIQDEVDDSRHIYRPYTSYVYFTPKKAAVKVYFKRNVRYRNIDIYVPLSFFTEWAKLNSGINRFLEQITKNQYGHLFPAGIPICAKIAAILTNLKECTLHGITRDLHMKRKILELLGLFFQEEERAKQQQEDLPSIKLVANDIATLKEIRQLLKQHPEQFLTIAHLSKKFNINDFKLKKGFKKLFNKGIFEYAQDVRMNKGLVLLTETRYPIKDIAYQLGYSSPSAFNVAFKRQYGLPPNRFRSNGT